MATRNVETFRAAHDSFNRRDFNETLKTLAEDCTYRDRPRDASIKGKNKFKEYLEAWSKGFSDGKILNPEYIDAGDTVIAQFTFAGTNDGSFLGLPATGRHISMPACEIVRYDSKGRAISADIYYDQYTLMTQLGHMKPLATAA
jgi:steroid delta-isomerase-like uncharacterized protein